MQSYVTTAQLRNLGIALEGAELESLLTHLNDTVEERIGADIAAGLTDKQLDTLLNLQETADDSTLHAWIEEHVPDADTIVQNAIDIVLGELADGADKVAPHQ